MKIEFLKILKNKVTYIAIAFLLIIVCQNVYFAMNEYNLEHQLALKIYSDYPDVPSLIAPCLYWIGISKSFATGFYYFIFPLLVSLPVVDSIFKEKNNQYINYELTRMSRNRFYVQKYIATFIISFMLFIIPIIIGNMVINLLTQHWDYSNFSMTYSKLVNGTFHVNDNVFEGYKLDLFSGLMEKSPYLYFAVYYIIASCFAGLYACFGLSISLLVKNRYLILFSPFLLYLGGWIAFSITGLLQWDPFNIIVPLGGISNMIYLPYAVDLFVLLLLSLGIYIYGVKKNEDIL